MKTFFYKAIFISAITLLMVGCVCNPCRFRTGTVTKPATTIGMCPITGHVSSTTLNGQRDSL